MKFCNKNILNMNLLELLNTADGNIIFKNTNIILNNISIMLNFFQ